VIYISTERQYDLDLSCAKAEAKNKTRRLLQQPSCFDSCVLFTAIGR
jgi:hypothetical protein